MLRRQFLRFLAASPLAGSAVAKSDLCEQPAVPQPEVAPMTYRGGSIEFRGDMILIADQDGHPRIRIGRW